MRGVFDDEELKPSPVRRDTELTLGTGMLLAIFLGLVLLCGLCFGLGYTVGRHGAQPSLAASTQPTSGGSAAETDNSLAKPSATTQVAPATPADADQQPASGLSGAPSDTAPTAAAATQPAPVQTAATPGQPLTHPALTPAVATTQSATPAASASQHAALTPASAVPAGAPQAGGLMVQIAAVSNAEDADVLTGALRKRGYVVTARRDPADNLIHVRIGPFGTAAEANTWKMKLLNDGYNAVVQP
jgi:cell division septation protein DedD